MIYESVIEQLSRRGIDSPRLEARMLIAAVKNLEPSQVSRDTELSNQELQRLEQYLQRRLAHEPIDKILGQKEFYKYQFFVSSNVLSPRCDTELLLETVLDLVRNKCFSRVLELGVGSGCVLLSLLKEVEHLEGVGVDISPKALEICAKNAERLAVEKRCQLLCQSWTNTDLIHTISQKFDLVFSNPPYIVSADIHQLEPEVKNFDPLVALDGGKDGLDCYRQIAGFAPELLNDCGYIVLEIGKGQAQDVRTIFESQSFRN